MLDLSQHGDCAAGIASAPAKIRVFGRLSLRSEADGEARKAAIRAVARQLLK
jgi:hypothetical protein